VPRASGRRAAARVTACVPADGLKQAVYDGRWYGRDVPRAHASKREGGSHGTLGISGTPCCPPHGARSHHSWHPACHARRMRLRIRLGSLRTLATFTGSGNGGTAHFVTSGDWVLVATMDKGGDWTVTIEVPQSDTTAEVLPTPVPTAVPTEPPAPTDTPGPSVAKLPFTLSGSRFANDFAHPFTAGVQWHYTVRCVNPGSPYSLASRQVVDFGHGVLPRGSHGSASPRASGPARAAGQSRLVRAGSLA
jgi:hypothetical protein